MHKPIQKYISLCALVSMSMIHAVDVAPNFAIRSQAFNSVRRVPSQTYHHVHLPGYGDDGCGPAYGSFWLTGEYTRSFRGYDIAKCLFGDAINNNHCMKIQGSQVAGRDANALLADYFYLPTDFDSCVCFSPRIQNAILDMNYYVGMDNIWKGLYFAMEAPLTWTKWALNIRENVQNPGVNSDNAGYFTANTLARSALNTNFTSFAAGNAPGTITQVSSDTVLPTQTTTQLQGLQFAKMRKSASKTTISELRYYLGWNFLLEDDYHVGFHLEASAPTGNRPGAEWLFEPQNGNGKHTEFGAGVHGHYTFWNSEDESNSWTFEAALDVTHLFKTHQTRTFDLIDKPLSRYMPVLQMGSEIVLGLENAGGTAPVAQFKNFITPLANITTFDVDVSVGAQIDFIAFFRYSQDNFMCGEGNMTWDFGYNLYYRSCENIDLRCGCTQFDETTWALKGDAQVYGYAVSATPLVTASVPLSATENEATINSGTNFGVNGAVNAAALLAGQQNPNIDNPALAFGLGVPLRTNFADDVSAANPQINSSFDPIFIKQSDINFARTQQITHKLFSKWQFTFADGEKWVPYVGWGFEAEFAQGEGKDCNTCETTECDTGCDTTCDTSCETTNGTCLRCGLSQWGLFANIGISYQ